MLSPAQPSTEDKLAWCERYGLPTERDFVHDRLPRTGVTGYINPQKFCDPYTHDLFVNVAGDVKTVRTPLFKARELFDVDPQYAVTFNLKDGERYDRLYPNILVVFDVKWAADACEREIAGVRYRVEPMELVAAGFLTDVARAIQESGSRRIDYQRRVQDTQGNAKSSFVFDVRNLHILSQSL